ncbi:MAG: MGMT family protein [Planctomycetota bacterium]|jgi:hypothetical protein|nr:MGMT family protein [Planctomycetota bacterium]
MPKKKKSWHEKLMDDKDLPRVGPVDEKSKRFGEGVMVIPAPRQVDAVMKKVRKGKLVTFDQIREAIARNNDADFACPLTTGIFAWIASHAAAEQRDAGKKRITPYWRTLKKGGELNPKYPGGVDAMRELLEAEGHTVIQKGKKWLVADYEKSLMLLT